MLKQNKNLNIGIISSYRFFSKYLLSFFFQSKYQPGFLATKFLRQLLCTLVVPSIRTKRMLCVALLAFTEMVQRWPDAVLFRDKTLLVRWGFRRYFLWDFWLLLVFQVLPRKLNKPAVLSEIPYHDSSSQTFRIWLQPSSYTQDRWYDCVPLNNLTLCLQWKFFKLTRTSEGFLAGWVFWQNFLRAINCPLQLRR